MRFQATPLCNSVTNSGCPFGQQTSVVNLSSFLCVLRDSAPLRDVLSTLDNIGTKSQYITEGKGLSASITASHCEKVS
jgi:hypothetical protein